MRFEVIQGGKKPDQPPAIRSQEPKASTKLELIQGGKKNVGDELWESHAAAKQYLGTAYNQKKVDAIAGVRGWDVVLAELAALPKTGDPGAWYNEEDNAGSIELLGGIRD